MEQTTVLVVGLGRGAAWAREIKAAPGLTIAGLVDVDPARLAAVGAELDVPATLHYTSYAEALAKPADIIILAVPTTMHMSMSLDGLRASHHVICEKPLAMNMAEARELRTAVKQYKHRFMVSEQYRFADGVENLRLAIADGKIGKVGYISHEFFKGTGNAAGRWATSTHWSRAYVEGSLHDMSVHHFDMWYYITGQKPVEVKVKPFDPSWSKIGRRFGYSIYANLADGTHIDYITARAMTRPETSWFGAMWIVGEAGSLYWDGDSFDVQLYKAAPSPSATYDPFTQSLTSEKLDYVKGGVTNTNGPLAPLIRSLAAAIREGKPHTCDIEDNWPSFATAMAAVESALTGETVKVESE